tara:strand:+ start:861 stop:1169 length:309 start_codon:yes stop_codon:yes gene_type:complete
MTDITDEHICVMAPIYHLKDLDMLNDVSIDDEEEFIEVYVKKMDNEPMDRTGYIRTQFIIEKFDLKIDKYYHDSSRFGYGIRNIMDDYYDKLEWQEEEEENC